MIHFNRRQAIWVASGALLPKIESALADSASTKYLGQDYLSAFELQEFAVGTSRETEFDQSLIKFVGQGFALRKRAVEDARNSKLFTDSKKAISALDEAKGERVGKDYSLNGEYLQAQKDAIVFVSSNSVSLVPDSRDVLPIGIAAADPVEKKSEDTDFTVILDIALQTIGIFDGKELGDEILKDPDCFKLLKEIAPSVQKSDWQKILHLAERFFQLLIAHGFLKIYGARLAFRLSVRCVPILGWAYVIAAFIIALKANYHRFSFA